MSVQAGYNGGVPITHEFFIREMSGKLNYVIAQELMPEMNEAKRIQYMDEKEVQYRKYFSFIKRNYIFSFQPVEIASHDLNRISQEAKYATHATMYIIC
jgi:hypothetical protein